LDKRACVREAPLASVTHALYICNHSVCVLFVFLIWGDEPSHGVLSFVRPSPHNRIFLIFRNEGGQESACLPSFTSTATTSAFAIALLQCVSLTYSPALSFSVRGDVISGCCQLKL
jgi:hypothetical protein